MTERGGGKGRNKESDRKEEISSTEFPESGDTIYTERRPGIPSGTPSDYKVKFNLV